MRAYDFTRVSSPKPTGLTGLALPALGGATGWGVAPTLGETVEHAEICESYCITIYCI